MSERTPAQQIADYRKTFPKKVNARRLELIGKEFSGVTPEESARPFAENPGWQEECERRRHANLTDAERAELAECNRILDEWHERSPQRQNRIAFAEALDRRFDAIRARIEARKRGGAAE